LAAVRAVNRLESVVETMRATLNAVATVAPEWLRARAPAEWFEPYSHRAEDFRLPQGKQVREDHAALIGADGFTLIAAIESDDAPLEVRGLPAVNTLRAMWVHQYEPHRPGEPARWRKAADLPPASVRFDSPYDPEAHFGNKHPQSWLGYKVHLTEACGASEAHLITHVETTSATLPDISMTGVLHRALAAKSLLPGEHLVDAGLSLGRAPGQQRARPRRGPDWPAPRQRGLAGARGLRV
jgi:transposase